MVAMIVAVVAADMVGVGIGIRISSLAADQFALDALTLIIVENNIEEWGMMTPLFFRLIHGRIRLCLPSEEFFASLSRRR